MTREETQDRVPEEPWRGWERLRSRQDRRPGAGHVAAAGLREGQLRPGGLSDRRADPGKAAQLKGEGGDGPRHQKMGLMGRPCGVSLELLKQSQGNWSCR